MVLMIKTVINILSELVVAGIKFSQTLDTAYSLQWLLAFVWPTMT